MPPIRPRDVELFRDRSPIEPEPEEVERDPESAIEPDQVDAALVREVLLGAIGNLRAKVASGRFGSLDAQQLDKLLELAKDWPQLAKAVDELKAWGDQQAAASEALKSAAPATRDTVRRLRSVLGK